MNQIDKDFEQRVKVADAVKKYNENPTPENSSKFLVELAKLGIVRSNNTCPVLKNLDWDLYC